MINIFAAFFFSALLFPTVFGYAQEFSVSQALETVNSAKLAVPQVEPTGANTVANAHNTVPRSKDWTVMIYVNGKSNLESSAIEDMIEMEKIGSTRRVHIVAEVGRMKGYSAMDGDWTGSRRYHVTEEYDTYNYGKIKSKPVQYLPDADMGDWKHLVNFVEWAKRNYPSKKYALIVWNHGSGWKSSPIPRQMPRAPAPKGISYDYATGSHISTQEMAQALGYMGKIDVYGSDACLMQGVEVAYEMSKYPEIIVGSEEIEPGSGYDYTGFLRQLTQNPSASAEDVGKMIASTYINATKSGKATQSVIRTDMVEPLLGLLDRFAAVALASGNTELLKTAAKTADYFYDPEAVDLGSFMKNVADLAAHPGLKAAAQSVLGHISINLVAYNGVNSSHKDSMGISIYIPRGVYSPSYNRLAFAQNCIWDELVKQVFSQEKEPEPASNIVVVPFNPYYHN